MSTTCTHLVYNRFVSDKSTSITVRMSKELYEEIGRLAAEQDRSLNYVIVHLLKQALATRPA